MNRRAIDNHPKLSKRRRREIDAESDSRDLSEVILTTQLTTHDQTEFGEAARSLIDFQVVNLAEDIASGNEATRLTARQQMEILSESRHQNFDDTGSSVATMNQLSKSNVEHYLLPLSGLDKYKHLQGTNSRAKRTCKSCHKKASFYCAICSNPEQNFIATLCNVSNRKDTTTLSCFAKFHKRGEELVEPEQVQDGEGSELHVCENEEHILLPLSKLDQYKHLQGSNNRAKRRCKICQKKASYYCVNCSSPEHQQIITLCSLTKRNREAGESSCYFRYHNPSSTTEDPSLLQSGDNEQESQSSSFLHETTHFEPDIAVDMYSGDNNHHSEHRLLPFSSLEKYKHLHGTQNRAKRHCKMCHKKTSYFCATCSRPDQEFFASLCNIMNRKDLSSPSCYSRYHLTDNSLSHENIGVVGLDENSADSTAGPNQNGIDQPNIQCPEHVLLPLSGLDRYQYLQGTTSRAKRRCRVCHKNASYYCARCSKVEDDNFISLCSVTKSSNLTAPTCFTKFHSEVPIPECL